MPLLRISSPPCWKPFHSNADASTVHRLPRPVPADPSGAAVGQKIVDDQHMILRGDGTFGHDDVVYLFMGEGLDLGLVVVRSPD